MKSVHLFRRLHHFKALALASLTLVVLGAFVGLYWLNSHGFAGRWSERIATELTRRGIHAEFESVRFSPTRGVIVKKVLFFTDETRREVYARIPVLRFEVDRGKAFRGKLQIRRANIEKAQLTVPVGEDLSLQIDDLTGRASVDRHNRLRLEADRGTLGGMKFQLKIELDGFQLGNLPDGLDTKTSSERRASFTRDLLKELARWSFPADGPPLLRLHVKGSLDQPTRIRTTISLTADELKRLNYPMEDVHISGELDSRALTIDALRFSDGGGQLSLQAHYDLEDRTGGYQGSSSIQITDLLRNGLQDDSLSQFVSPHAPQLDARGKFALGEEGIRLSAIGSLSCNHFRFLDIPFDKINTEFSWQNGDIYLRNLIVKHETGELTGEVKLKDDLVQYRARSSLPLSAYQPFMKEKAGLERTLADSKFTSESRILIDARGSIQRSNLRDWDATGTLRIENFFYNEVPIVLAAADFYMSPLDYIFDNVEAVFDYRTHERRKEFEGPASGTIRARQVHFDAETELTSLITLKGKAWPAPLLQLFLPDTARYIAETYRFRNPPSLVANGIIDHRNPDTRTDMLTEVTADGLTDCSFLGQSVEVSGLSGKINVRHRQNEITELTMEALGGRIDGSVTHRSHPDRLSIGLQCRDLDISKVSTTFDFSTVIPGSLTASVTAEASRDPGDDGTGKWGVEGSCKLGTCSYNEVPIAGGSTRFAIGPEGYTFTDGKLEFDYTDYLLRKRHGGPQRANMQVDRIQYHRENHTTDIANLTGSVWPGPLLRLVDSKGADLVDEMFGFHQPPLISTSGRADHSKPGTGTLLTSTVKGQGIIDYEFLDRTLQLTSASASIKTTPNRHEVKKLLFGTFGGTGGGEITVTSTPEESTLIEAGLRWDDLNLSEIGRTFEFEKAPQGKITGRIDFTTLAGRTDTLNGKGVIGLRNGQLFHVPIFGPLSLPLGTVLSKEFSHEQARDASTTFVLKNGVAFTRDFLTSTPSTTFVGEGSVDLVNKQVDLTMRMNARGLLGLVTLPLTPVKGLFQFRGQGPLSKPAWRSAPFTQPAGGRSHPIFKTPRAKIVPER